MKKQMDRDIRLLFIFLILLQLALVGQGVTLVRSPIFCAFTIAKLIQSG